MEKRIAKILKTIKPFVKPFLVVMAIYSIAMLAIWRGGISNADDIRRAMQGDAWQGDYNRYSQSLLSYVLNVNFKLTDISPFPQIVAMAFLSIASVIVTYVFCNRKIKYLPLVLSTFIGLTPLTINCWLYKFDAPGMALGVLASVIPILFWQKLDSRFRLRKWLMLSIVPLLCLMVMWTSYQTTNGILLVLIAGLVLKDFIDKEKLKTIFKKATFFSTIYLVAATIFFIILPSPSGYRDTETFGIFEMASGVLTNIKNLVKSLRDSLNIEWMILLAVVAVCFFASLVIFSKRKKISRLVDVLAATVFVTISIPLSYGVYLFLEHPDFRGRFTMGTGVVLAIIAIILSRNLRTYRQKILAVPNLVLLYSFMVFAWALGNAMTDQHRWALFRNEILLNDLSHIYTSREDVAETTMQVQGRIGKSRVMRHVSGQYPVVKKIIAVSEEGLSPNSLGTRMLRHYYGRPQEFVIAKNEEWDCSTMRTELDTYYHTIKTDDTGRVCVLIK